MKAYLHLITGKEILVIESVEDFYLMHVIIENEFQTTRKSRKSTLNGYFRLLENCKLCKEGIESFNINKNEHIYYIEPTVTALKKPKTITKKELETEWEPLQNFIKKL